MSPDFLRGVLASPVSDCRTVHVSLAIATLYGALGSVWLTWGRA